MGITELLSPRNLSKQIFLHIFNPNLFLILLLLSYLFFFSDLPHWWILQLTLQFTICFIGCFIPSWRWTAIIAAVLIIYFNLGWFAINPKIPETCQNHIDKISGVSKSSTFQTSANLSLIKTEIQCQGKSIRWPSAEIRIRKAGNKKIGWFQIGDRIELKQLKLTGYNFWTLQLEQQGRSRIFNLSRQEKILSRSGILLYLQNKSRYYLSKFPNSIFKALITADRTDLSKRWKKHFQDLGIFHIFAISGMHIGILYLWLSLFFRLVISFPVAWIEKGYGLMIGDVISLILIYLFLDIIGMPISAKRALIMLTWWISVKHFFTWQSPWFILMGTATLILVSQPLAIGQISFQLSFLSVSGILAILHLLPKPKLKDSFWKSLGKFVCSSMIISGWLYLFTFPLVDQLYQNHSIATFLNNVLHISFLSFLYIPTALITMIYTLLGYQIGGMPGEFFLYSFVNFLSKLWEWLLFWNEKFNSLWAWNPEWDWSFSQMLIYWIIILLIPVGASYLIRLRNNLHK